MRQRRVGLWLLSIVLIVAGLGFNVWAWQPGGTSKQAERYRTEQQVYEHMLTRLLAADGIETADCIGRYREEAEKAKEEDAKAKEATEDKAKSQNGQANGTPPPPSMPRTAILIGDGRW